MTSSRRTTVLVPALTIATLVLLGGLIALWLMTARVIGSAQLPDGRSVTIAAGFAGFGSSVQPSGTTVTAAGREVRFVPFPFIDEGGQRKEQTTVYVDGAEIVILDATIEQLELDFGKTVQLRSRGAVIAETD